MKSGAIPFKFDMGDLLARAKRQVNSRLGDVTLNLPFISIAVSPKDRERQMARELVIRLRDRRVLSAWECCDGCIDNALKSLSEIRQIIVDKQVELAELHDGPLYLLLDTMALGLRQFMRSCCDATMMPRRIPTSRTSTDRQIPDRPTSTGWSFCAGI
jgi:hypothetical protein